MSPRQAFQRTSTFIVLSRASNEWTCRFGYDDNVIRDYTFLGETTNRVIYRRRQAEDLKLVPYNAKMTKAFRAHINVERTQGGGAIAYLMKYAFKVPKLVQIELRTEDEQGERPIQKDIRAYMRAKVCGSVEAVWRLLEYQNVRLVPAVERLAIHFPGERTALVRNPRLPQRLNSSTLERYFKCPEEFCNDLI